MPDPFLILLAVTAVACLLLYPIRLWRQKHHRYGNEAGEGGEDVPLAPPERRNRG
jgi:hypothetical protein